LANDLARPALGDAELGADLLNSLPAARGADCFPDNASVRMSLSSVRSDTAFRSRLFSNSRSFKRRT
jgi:hypothetical protein